MVLLLAEVTARAASCEETVALEQLRAGLRSSWEVIVAGDLAAGRERSLAVEPALACLEGPITPADAAAFHRNRSVVIGFEGDATGARSAAGAAARLDPEAAAGWVQACPAFAELVQQSVPLSLSEDFPTSLAAVVYVDGATAPTRPVGEPVLVQVFGPDGRPLGGAWVSARDPLPDWVAYPDYACDAVATIDGIVQSVRRAEEAYAALDVDTFEQSLREVASGLPCVERRVSPPQAAAIHRLEGIRLVVHGAKSSAVRSFQEARALDPLYVPPESIIRPGSSLAALWDQAGLAAPSPWRTEPVPAPLELAVDGITSSVRPAALPSIVQAITPTGEALWTEYVPPGADLPDLEPFRAEAERRAWEELPPATRLYLEAGAKRTALNRRVGLVVAAGVVLTGSASLYVTNAVTTAEFSDPGTPHRRLHELRSTANLAGTGSSILLVVGASLAGAAVLVK